MPLAVRIAGCIFLCILVLGLAYMQVVNAGARQRAANAVNDEAPAQEPVQEPVQELVRLASPPDAAGGPDFTENAPQDDALADKMLVDADDAAPDQETDPDADFSYEASPEIVKIADEAALADPISADYSPDDDALDGITSRAEQEIVQAVDADQIDEEYEEALSATALAAAADLTDDAIDENAPGAADDDEPVVLNSVAVEPANETAPDGLDAPADEAPSDETQPVQAAQVAWAPAAAPAPSLADRSQFAANDDANAPVEFVQQLTARLDDAGIVFLEGRDRNLLSGDDPINATEGALGFPFKKAPDDWIADMAAPEYPAACEAQAGAAETVLVRFRVSRRGRVYRPRIYGVSSDCFNDEALKNTRRIDFRARPRSETSYAGMVFLARYQFAKVNTPAP